MVLSNADYNRITANLRDAEQALATEKVPGPDRRVQHLTSLARDLRVHTGYARAADEAHTLISQALQQSGDIIPGDGTLTIRLDPLPTRRATNALTELCEHLTATTPVPEPSNSVDGTC